MSAGYTSVVWKGQLGTASIVIDLDQFGPLYCVRVHDNALSTTSSKWFLSRDKAFLEYTRQELLAEEAVKGD